MTETLNSMLMVFDSTLLIFPHFNSVTRPESRIYLFSKNALGENTLVIHLPLLLLSGCRAVDKWPATLLP